MFGREDIHCGGADGRIYVCPRLQMAQWSPTALSHYVGRVVSVRSDGTIEW